MMRSGWTTGWVWVICAQLALSVAQAEPPADWPSTFHEGRLADHTGEHRFTLFIPEHYRSDRRWPIVVFLHGAGERGSDGRAPVSTGLATYLEDHPRAPFIAVFPQCEDRDGQALAGWRADGPDAQRALRLLEFVESQLSIDRERRILIGWSMGGYGAWNLARAHPDMWSAVLALSGGALDPSLESLSNLAAARTPVWALHGVDDQLIPAQRSSQLCDSLQQVGGRSYCTLLPQQGHDVWRHVLGNPQVWDWLLAPQGAPPELDPQSPPLPSRTRWRRAQQQHDWTIPGALTVRVNNDALQRLARDLPVNAPASALQGELDDLTRVAGSGSEQIHLRLADVRYRCDLQSILLQGISGGRLRVQLFAKPLELFAGTIQLRSQQHEADTGPITITLGVHRPVELTLEVQPVVAAGRVQLRLLRRRFLIPDGNWYITPPEVLRFRSPQFTPDQLVTGIVGSLYARKAEIEEEVLKITPDLLRLLEEELTAHEAPRLAAWLSPLPAVAPDLEVCLGQARTDRNGFGMLFNFRFPATSTVGMAPSITGADLSAGPAPLRLDLSLAGLAAFSRPLVEAELARVNVLDVPDNALASLADSAVMSRIFPELNPAGLSLCTVLHLSQPVALRAENLPAKPSNSPASGVDLILTAPQLSLDIWRTEGSDRLPLGRLNFALQQPVQLSVSDVDGESEAATSLQIRWGQHPQVQFLGIDSLPHQASLPTVTPADAVDVFLTAWRNWLQTQDSRVLSPESWGWRHAQLHPSSLTVEGDRLRVEFK